MSSVKEVYLLSFIYLLHSIVCIPTPDEIYGDLTGKKATNKWNKIGQDELETVLRMIKDNTNRAKNVILFLGDGMGPTTVTAARFYMSESRKTPIENTAFSWEKFEHSAISKTYTVDKMTPGSAATATAYLCGVKTNYKVIGYNQNVKKYNCTTEEEENKVFSILHETKQNKDKWTGVVSLARVTHATPAASYAHTANRGWEYSVPPYIDDYENCRDIASQLILDNNDIRVVLGGGRDNFIPREDGGKRFDSENLIEKWKKIQNSKVDDENKVKYVTTQKELNEVVPTEAEYLMGLFSPSHMNYEIERLMDKNNSQPSLVEMTVKAIKMLQQAKDGYFLLVEGALIDKGHHDNRAFVAFNETVMFSDAVQKAIELTSSEDTLIVVTADHDHTMTMSGYANTENGILGMVHNDKEDYDAADNKPRLTINYANGPGHFVHRQDGNGNSVPRKDISNDDTSSTEYVQDAAIPFRSETHGGGDVVIYATGPMAHLFKGVHEQNYIKHAMSYASCVGQNLDHCSKANHAGRVTIHGVLLLVFYIFTFIY